MLLCTRYFPYMIFNLHSNSVKEVYYFQDEESERAGSLSKVTAGIHGRIEISIKFCPTLQLFPPAQTLYTQCTSN